MEQYEPQPDLQAQKAGEGASLMVQVGRGDTPEERRHAVTLAITQASDGQPGVVVTMGQQQWLTPRMATYRAATPAAALPATVVALSLHGHHPWWNSP